MTKSHGFDTACFQEWGHLLTTASWERFYDLTTCGDHLPGDLVVHGAVARSFVLVGGEIPSPPYALALKVIACLADLLLACAAWRLAGRMAGAVVLATPVTWLVSAWWGQWDALSLALVLCGAVLLRLTGPSGWAGVPLLAWAVLVKPPLALLALPLVVWRCTRPSTPRPAWRFCLAGTLGAATVQLLGSAIGVGLPGTGARWSVLDRLAVAAAEYDAATLGATNVWMWLSRPTWQSDGTLLVGVPLGIVGAGATVTWCVGCGWLALRRRDGLPGVAAALWCGTTMHAGWYLFATRSHERYGFASAVAAVLVAALLPTDGWARAAAWLLGIPCAGTVLLTLTTWGAGEVRLWCYRGLALLTLAGCFALLAVGSSPERRRTARSTTSSA